ncbi:MAG: fumarylacetoacetate hydrolase family protein [Candidatus Kapaibacteriales bacterium]
MDIFNTIYCIGRNYAEHAKELGNDVPKEPLVFLKSGSSLFLSEGNMSTVSPPKYSNDCHYEAEIVLKVGFVDDMPIVSALAAGIDYTLRDIQSEVKAKGHPWTKAKNFRKAASVGNFFALKKEIEPSSLSISLKKNGGLVQQGSADQMIFSVEIILDYLNTNYGLSEGDLIFTGTPSGVGKCESGDKLVAEVYFEGSMVSKLEQDISL